MNKTVRIISRFDSYTGIGRHGWSFIEALTITEKKFNIEAIITNPDNLNKSDLRALQKLNVTIRTYEQIKDKSDIAIFCDVLFQSDSSMHKLGHINALYFAWDSTKIPDSFVDVINFDFDFVIVPTDFVKQSLIDSGVILDILILPLVVKEIPTLPITQQDIFTFGFIGSYEERKNVDILIEAFLQTLSSTAKLRIHLTYSHIPEKKLDMLLKKYNSDIVKITIGKLDNNNFFRLLNEFDCFISLSKGEGFSIIPYEYMNFNKPIILSYSSAHKSIPKIDGIWFIESDIPYRAHYPQIDNKYYGLFYGPYFEDIILALNYIWKEIQDKKTYPNLSNYVKNFSAVSLGEKYNTIIEPKSIIKSTFTSHISPYRCLTLKSEKLIEKYSIEKTNAKSKKHVVLANDGGFFSIFNRYISILACETDEDPDSIVIPDWRISSLTEYLGHKTFTSFCYGTENDGNIFLKIFKPAFNIPESCYNDPEFLRNNAILRTDYNEEKEPNLTYIHAYKLYNSKGFQKWRQKYHKYFSKNIALRNDLQHYITEFKKNNFDGYYVISAHIRHPSHGMEQPNGRIPTAEVFKENIEKQIEIISKVQNKPIRLFIASDQDSVINYFTRYFGDILITTFAKRVTEENDKQYENTYSSEKQKEGFQIQHLIASDSSMWSVKMADEVIIDAWLLSYSDVFIHITSNIATAVSFINPKVKMIYCN